MNKKNYNLEIFFESQKKSFVILSKNKITFDEVKQKTIREFRIPKEYEKDMRFTIKIRNRPITILNDAQILNNFEEMSKNNYYLKINFNINNNNFNNNYIYQSSKSPINKYNQKMRPNTVNAFSIISSKINDKNENEDKNNENKYKEEIKKLKEEIEKLKSEKSNKGEFDIRKFDEKYRDLSNKNNILEQKITELENENKTLKTGINKNTVFTDNLLFENTFENDSMIKEIEKIVSKLISEQNENIIKEINGLKNSVEIIQKEQKNFYGKFKALDENSEFFKPDKAIEIIQNDEGEKNINDKDEEKINLNNNDKITNKNNSKKNKTINNINSDDNFEDLDNIADIIMNDKEEDNKNCNFQNSNSNNNKEEEKEQNSKEQNSNNSKDVKRNINFYEEDEKNSPQSKFKKIEKKEKDKKSLIKEIKDSFMENNNNIILKNKKNLKIDMDNKKEIEKAYSKYTASSKKKTSEKMKISNKKKVFNYSNINTNKDISAYLINWDSSSEINSYFKKLNSESRVDTSNSHKNMFVNIEDKKKNNSNNLNKFLYNDKSLTPTGVNNISDRTEKNSFINKKESITPNGKMNSIKENIENYFINIFQNIFFYGNNGYMNMLKISDKLLNKLKEGLNKFRMNIEEIKDYYIKYINYTILPIVNDSNTKEYQRIIIKNKIATILEILRIDRKYFDKEYKEFNEDKKEKNYIERNITGINITHTKINDFRKFYDLKEKDYPDEIIIKALIRYRGNRELAFQYLFY